MRVSIIAIQIIFTTTVLYSQKYKSAIEEFSRSVVYLNTTKIRTEKINGQDYEVWFKKPNSNQFIPATYQVTGSGFLIAEGPSHYLVTAQHLAKSTSLDTRITIKDSLDNPVTHPLRDFLKANESPNWTTHDTADVAVLLLEPSSQASRKSYFNFLPIEIIEQKLESPIREREVTIIGFPLSLGVNRKFSPISKTAKPSSDLIELPRSDTKTTTIFYLLDDPSVSGFSGSPVFELPTNLLIDRTRIFVDVYRLVGLVHGTVSDKIGGFAAVVPSSYIYETIQMAPKYTGVYTFYFPDGNVWSKRYYKDGIPWTVISNYDATGSPVEMGTLKDGNGSLFIYDLDGSLLEIQYYESGKLIKTEKSKK